MKISAAKEPKIAPSNLTDSELASHVRFEFPNLTGALAMLLQRFERCCGECLPFLPTCHDEKPCPNCGTPLIVTVEQNDITEAMEGF